MELRTELYDGLWNALYFLIVVAFFIANLLYAGAMWRWPGLSRVVGAFYLLAAVQTLLIIVGEITGIQLVPESVDFWIYPLTQPLARALIGAWLWTHRDESRALPTAPVALAA